LSIALILAFSFAAICSASFAILDGLLERCGLYVVGGPASSKCWLDFGLPGFPFGSCVVSGASSRFNPLDAEAPVSCINLLIKFGSLPSVSVPRFVPIQFAAFVLRLCSISLLACSASSKSRFSFSSLSPEIVS
jgi:hypothetical protein